VELSSILADFVGGSATSEDDIIWSADRLAVESPASKESDLPISGSILLFAKSFSAAWGILLSRELRRLPFPIPLPLRTTFGGLVLLDALGFAALDWSAGGTFVLLFRLVAEERRFPLPLTASRLSGSPIIGT
jgi:hypothetical protein